MQNDIKRILGEYVFCPDWQPVWKEGCLSAWLYDDLFSGSFRPTKGNVLLVGDAAGLKIPVTREGIGSALRSGVLAVSAIVQAEEQGVEAEEIYLEKLEGMIITLKRFYALSRKVEEEAIKGPQALSAALTDAWRQAIYAT